MVFPGAGNLRGTSDASEVTPSARGVPRRDNLSPYLAPLSTPRRFRFSWHPTARVHVSDATAFFFLSKLSLFVDASLSVL